MKRLLLVAAFCSVLACSNLAIAAENMTGPLADYIAKEDNSYRWVERRRGDIGAGSYVELTLTSQTWRGIVWKHQLFIIKPSTNDPKVKHALLFITGGRWKKEYEEPTTETKLPSEATLFGLIAERLKTPVAVLLQVPQQPIFDGKFEDQIIAHTFNQYFKTGDKEWPLLLPMVKSAVKGMDATQEFTNQEWKLNIETFTITGASKRGWTTWLTGAADQRATAIAPMVIDVLDIGRQMQHQKDIWGKYSEQIGDYSKLDLPNRLKTDEGKSLLAIVDPYSYRKILTQPKLIMIGTNDRYWPLDALNLYWNDLQGPKHILYIPNNGHGLKDYPRIIGGLTALHHQAAFGKKMPKLDWKFTNGGKKLTLNVESDRQPERVRAWIATSQTKDFRQSVWSDFETSNGGGSYQYVMELPEKGYSAMFGEAMFDDGAFPYYLSTNVYVIDSNGESLSPSPRAK